MGKPDAIKPSVSAVIFNEAGEICLQKRSDINYWGIPGGNLEIGEGVEGGLLREVIEETGLRVKVESLVGVYSAPHSMTVAIYPTGGVVQYVNICFRCTVAGGELSGSNEGEVVRFIAPDRLPSDTLAGHVIRIEDALSQLSGAGGPVIK